MSEKQVAKAIMAEELTSCSISFTSNKIKPGFKLMSVSKEISSLTRNNLIYCMYYVYKACVGDEMASQIIPCNWNSYKLNCNLTEFVSNVFFPSVHSGSFEFKLGFALLSDKLLITFPNMTEWRASISVIFQPEYSVCLHFSVPSGLMLFFRTCAPHRILVLHKSNMSLSSTFKLTREGLESEYPLTTFQNRTTWVIIRLPLSASEVSSSVVCPGRESVTYTLSSPCRAWEPSSVIPQSTCSLQPLGRYIHWM